MKFIITVVALLMVGCIQQDTSTIQTLDSPNASVTVKDPVTTSIKQVKTISINYEQAIFLTGEVDTGVSKLIDQIDELNNNPKYKEIYLIIDSPGGEVFNGAKLVSAMEASGKPIYTVCTSMCASMAAVIHQYGKKRMMLDRSILMFHDAAGGLQGSVPQMQSRLTLITRLTEKMDAYIAKRAGTVFQDFLNGLHSEIWMDAEDSTNRHYNDEIVYLKVKGEKPKYIYIMGTESVDPEQSPKPVDNRKLKLNNVYDNQ